MSLLIAFWLIAWQHNSTSYLLEKNSGRHEADCQLYRRTRKSTGENLSTSNSRRIPITIQLNVPFESATMTSAPFRVQTVRLQDLGPFVIPRRADRLRTYIYVTAEWRRQYSQYPHRFYITRAARCGCLPIATAGARMNSGSASDTGAGCVRDTTVRRTHVCRKVTINIEMVGKRRLFYLSALGCGCGGSGGGNSRSRERWSTASNRQWHARDGRRRIWRQISRRRRAFVLNENWSFRRCTWKFELRNNVTRAEISSSALPRDPDTWFISSFTCWRQPVWRHHRRRFRRRRYLRWRGSKTKTTVGLSGRRRMTTVTSSVSVADLSATRRSTGW